MELQKAKNKGLVCKSCEQPIKVREEYYAGLKEVNLHKECKDAFEAIQSLLEGPKNSKQFVTGKAQVYQVDAHTYKRIFNRHKGDNINAGPYSTNFICVVTNNINYVILKAEN